MIRLTPSLGVTTWSRVPGDVSSRRVAFEGLLPESISEHCAGRISSTTIHLRLRLLLRPVERRLTN
jgi:hypothetical protein